MDRRVVNWQFFVLFFIMLTQFNVLVYAFDDVSFQAVVNTFIGLKEIAQHDVEVCRNNTSPLLQALLVGAGLSMVAHAFYRYHTLTNEKEPKENPVKPYDPLEMLTLANNLFFVAFEYSYYILCSHNALSFQEKNISLLALTLFYLSNGRWCKARSFFKERAVYSSEHMWYENFLKVLLCVPGAERASGNNKKYLFFVSRSFLKMIDSFLVHASYDTDPARTSIFINFDTTQRAGYD